MGRLIEPIIAALKHVLDFAPEAATDLILRHEYEEEIELASPDDPDEIAMHRDRALELLAWRGARAAIHVFSTADMTQYVTSAQGEDRAILYCAAELNRQFRDLVAVDTSSEMTVPFTLPADQGLVGVPGLLKLEEVSPTLGWITLWAEWTDLLGEPPYRVDWVTAVARALSQGRKEALRPPPAVALVAADSSDQAMNLLQRILGTLLDGLCPESYATLLASQQIRLLKDFADPSVAMICFGRAVEFQLRYQTEKRLGRSPLRTRLYPKRDNTNLGAFINNVDSLSVADLVTFEREWISRADAVKILSRFNGARNQAAHGTPQAKHLADRVVGDWLDLTQSETKLLWSVLVPR